MSPDHFPEICPSVSSQQGDMRTLGPSRLLPARVAGCKIFDNLIAKNDVSCVHSTVFMRAMHCTEQWRWYGVKIVGDPAFGDCLVGREHNLGGNYYLRE